MAEREEEKVICSNCGAEAREIEGSYLFKESGLSNVQLLGVDLIECPVCGNVDPVIPDVNDLMCALAWHICTSKYKLCGEEVRFLRKYLHMNATDFAKLLGVHKSTLSKWENNEDPLGSANERLIRSVTLALGEGLKDRVEEGIRLFTWIVEEQRCGPMNVDMETLEVQNA
jgi:YgiT-type zinc finger domain-containing protein